MCGSCGIDKLASLSVQNRVSFNKGPVIGISSGQVSVNLRKSFQKDFPRPPPPWMALCIHTEEPGEQVTSFLLESAGNRSQKPGLISSPLFCSLVFIRIFVCGPTKWLFFFYLLMKRRIGKLSLASVAAFEINETVEG